MTVRRLLLASIALGAAGGCHQRGGRDRIVVSVIGPSLAGPVRRQVHAPTAPELVLQGATGVGLLRLDEAGQINPGIAVRWAMIDDGPDGIFRIDDSGGRSTRRLAARLHAALTGSDRRWLGDGIEAIVPVTPSVIDLRLAEPRSDLPILLALPELATLDPNGGPLRLAGERGQALLLEPRVGSGEEPPPQILLRGERAGRAVARFAAGQSQLVLGGRFTDLPVARAATLPRGSLRFDRTIGLFGLAPADRSSPYARSEMLEALSLAIDRDRIVAAIGVPGAAKATTLAGSHYEAPLAERRGRAIARIGDNAGALPPLRLAMPSGPGGRMLYRLLAQDWSRLGITTTPAPDAAHADLALVDMVTPASERARAVCAIAAGCDAADKRALLAPPYIPLGTPVRWSLVAPDLDLFTSNALAVHPLDRLRSAR